MGTHRGSTEDGRDGRLSCNVDSFRKWRGTARCERPVHILIVEIGRSSNERSDSDLCAYEQSTGNQALSRAALFAEIDGNHAPGVIARRQSHANDYAERD